MNNVCIVGVLKPFSRLGNILSCKFIIEHPTFFDKLLQVRAINKFHDEIVGALVFVNIIGPDDVAMIEASRCLRLLLESCKIRRFFYASFGENFDGYPPLHQYMIG